VGKRDINVSDARRMTTKLNGISELLAFSTSTALGRAVNHTCRDCTLTLPTCARQQSLPSFRPIRRFQSPSASAAGFTALMRTEKRRTYTASCAMVHWITYHACSPFSLCRCLLITTHLACHHHLQGSGSGTGENLNPVFSICVRLRVVVPTGALREVGECLAAC
jgi:hypothetical protein